MMKMKKAVAVVMVAAWLLTGTTLAGSAAKAQVVSQVQYVAVNASGAVEVQPDIAYVNLGVTTVAKESAQARQKNTEILKKVTRAIEKAGVKTSDIKTEYVSMYPNYDFKNNSEIITGYTIANQLKITVQNVDKTGDIVNAAMAAGANMLNDISYDVKDREKYYKQAVDKAMKSAESKAKTLARASGLQLGQVLNISDSSYDYAPMLPKMSLDMAQDDQAVSGNIGDTLKPSLVTVSVNLAVTYGIK